MRFKLLLATATLVIASLAGAQSVTLAMSAQPDTLDPQVTAATAAFQVSKSLYDTLVESDRAGNLVPSLASSYTVSTDGLAYTFTLVEAMFHDGTWLDSTDVKASLDRIRDPATASPKLSEFTAITSIDTPDDRTVVINLSQPTPALIASLASGWGAILPSEKLAANHDFGNQPVGTGPYALSTWLRDNALTLSANDAYFQGAPQIQEVVIRFVPDSAVQLQGLITGEFDVIDNVAEADRDGVRANPALELVSEPSGLVLVAALNTRREYLSDPRVRRALNLAVDTDIVMEVAYGGGDQVGTFMEAGSPWMPEAVQPFAYDPEQARALLAAAGVPRNWTIDLALPQPYENHIQAGQIVQDFLADVGVNAQIRIVEWGVWLSEIYGGPRDFDMTVVGHTGKLDPSGRVGGYGVESTNYTGYTNADVADWIAQAAKEPNAVRRAALYTQALIRLHDDAPFIYFGTPSRTYARNANLEGFWITPLLDSFDFREARLN